MCEESLNSPLLGQHGQPKKFLTLYAVIEHIENGKTPLIMSTISTGITLKYHVKNIP